MVITPGLVGPKPIPNGGGDGQQVNIPAHWYVAMEGRSVVLIATYRIVVEGMRRLDRQIRLALLQVQSKDAATANSIIGSMLPRKSSKHKRIDSVPQSDTGGRVEKTKANE